MTTNRRVWQAMMVLVFVVLILGVAMRGTGYVKGGHTISGVIEHADENSITVKNTLHYIASIPLLDEKGRIVSDRGDALIGEIAIITYDNEQIVSATIFSYMDEKNINVEVEEAEEVDDLSVNAFESKLFDQCFRIDRSLCFK